MKQIRRRWLVFLLILTTLLIAFTFIFWPRRLTAFMEESSQNVSECSIIKSARGGEEAVSRILEGAELEELMDCISGILLSYRGPDQGVFLEPGEHTYNLYFIHRGTDTLFEFGRFHLDENGNFYFGGSKYSTCSGSSEALVSLIKGFLSTAEDKGTEDKGSPAREGD